MGLRSIHKMKKIPQKPIVIQPNKHQDERGFFVEIWNYKNLKKLGIGDPFVQENHSFSLRKGTFRGMHYQIPPYAQSKLVRCTRGSILDIAIDFRKGSPNFLKPYYQILSEENSHQFYLPIGFLHGFLTLQDNCEVVYCCNNYFSKVHDRSVKISLDALREEYLPSLSKLVLSEKDLNAPDINDIQTPFLFDGDIK